MFVTGEHPSFPLFCTRIESDRLPTHLHRRQLDLGIPLNEIKNTVTKETMACFGPSLDYCVVKINKNALSHLGPVVHHRLIRPLNLPACALSVPAFLPCRHRSYSSSSPTTLSRSAPPLCPATT